MNGVSVPQIGVHSGCVDRGQIGVEIRGNNTPNRGEIGVRTRGQIGVGIRGNSDPELG
jgi:hypothetical protein